MRFLSLVFVCCASFSAFAAVSGRVRLEEQAFVENQNRNLQRAETSALLEFEERGTYEEIWKFRFEPRLRLSSLAHSADVPLDGDFRDSLIERKIGEVRVQVGSFIKAWEGTDGLNPMDIATVRNYRDPLNSEAIGSVGLALSGSITEGVTFDALYVPWQTPTRLPGSSAAWWPQSISLPVRSGRYEALLPETPEYDLQRHGTLNYALQNNYGARLQYHAEGWDLSAAYFEGASQLPILQPIIHGNTVATLPDVDIVQMDNPILIHPIEYRRRTFAGAAVHTLESWIFRLAGRYDQPIGDSGLLPGWSGQVVGGVERTLTVSEQPVTLVGQLSYTNKGAARETVLDSPDPFQRGILLGVRFPYSDDLLFYLSGLIDAYKDSSAARLNVQRKFGSHWLAEVSGEWLRGSADSTLGQWRHESRGFLSGSYRF